MIKKSDVDKIIAKIDAKNTGELTYDQFKTVMDLIEERIAEEEEGVVAPAPVAAGKGFGKTPEVPQKSKQVAEDPQENADDVAKEIFDDLRGKRKTLSVVSFPPPPQFSLYFSYRLFRMLSKLGMMLPR